MNFSYSILILRLDLFNTDPTPIVYISSPIPTLMNLKTYVILPSNPWVAQRRNMITEEEQISL